MANKELKTRCVFAIYAKPEEAYDISKDIELEIIDYTKEDAIDKAKKILGEEYTYFKVREVIALELYKMKL